jgi:hypothetical protein
MEKEKKEEKEETSKEDEDTETITDEDAGETTESDKKLSTEETEKSSTKEPTITNQISNKITSIGENIDIPLVTKYVKIFASVLLITLPFVPLFFSLGGKKTKKHKRKITIKK